MAYGFTVKALNGRHWVTDVVGDTEDGEYRITCHDGAAQVNFRDAVGRWQTEPDRKPEKDPDSK